MAKVVLQNFFLNGNDDAESRYCTNFAESNSPFGERPGDCKRDENNAEAFENFANAGSNNYLRVVKQVQI